MAQVEKPEDVNIKMITTEPERSLIFGLGEDNKVYRWSPSDHKWFLYV